MGKLFFPKMAAGNLVRNRRFEFPYLLTGLITVAMFYNMTFLTFHEELKNMPGGATIPTIMNLGTMVVGLFAVIFLLYTNTFLMKRRHKEIGLYNILGMSKRHIAVVMLWETVYTCLITVVGGLLLGILLSKLMLLLLYKILFFSVSFGFMVSWKSVGITAVLFVAIYLVALLLNLLHVHLSKPVELLKGGSVGEKEPKTKVLLAILGVVTLGAGYYIAITTESPLEALMLFFLAVILVIIGTYFLFVAGSIFVLKALKKNKRFYYNKKHMPAVSGLLYRMKQNAVGLASIAILATGVLVMISTTVSLYAGAEETVKRNYPQDYYLSARYLQWSDEGQLLHSEDMPRETLLRAVERGAEKNGLTIKKMDFQEYLTVSYKNENGGLYCRQAGGNAADSLKGLSVMTYITQEMYRSLGGEALNLAENEIAVCPMDIRQRDFDRTEIAIEGDNYQVKTVLPEFPVRSGMEEVSTNCYGVVVADESVLARLYAQQKQVYGNAASDYTRRIAASFAGRGANGDVGEKLERDVEAYLKEAAFPQQQEPGESLVITGNTVWGARESVTAMCGALLFLGIILGLVCLFATVLIVYYKQISEGYEDRVRFQIMQKVGMSRREVKSTINSQVLLVFFLPLVVAGMHLAFAFPILEKVLHILLLSSTSLFVVCSLVTFGVFAAVYTLIYMATARTYYKIVR